MYVIKSNRKTNSYTVRKINRITQVVRVGRRGLQGDPATNLVQSVNGKQGVVVLNASDVNADPVGSASQALQDAKDYTDTKVSTLDSSLATVAKTGSYNDLGDKPTIPSIAGLATEAQVQDVQDNIDAHEADTANPHSVTKAQVGLGNVDNTSDADKPVSTAQQSALGGKVDKVTTAGQVYVTGDTAGTQAVMGRAISPTGSTIAQRTSGGVLRGATAVGADDLTTKAQMDAADSLKVNKAGDTMSGELNIVKSSGNNLLNVLAEGGGSAEAQLELKSGTTGSATMRMWMRQSDNAFGFYHRGVTRWRIDANGNFNFNVPTGVRIATSGAPTPGKMLEVAGDVRINGADYIVGTGFPNGVVTAPVGSTYVDTAATNGAIEWKKATGTGNTGWVVSVGDTGNRDISSLMLNGWTSASGRITMRRIGNTVNITASIAAGVNGTSATGDVFMDIPAGFEIRRQSYHNYDVLGSGYINFGGGSASVISRRFGSIATASRQAGFGFNLQYITESAWPSTLPGTAG